MKDLFSLGIFLVLSFALSFILLSFAFILTFDTKLDIEKSSVYECGFFPFSENRSPFDIHFYLIAVLFLLFDIEILYLFPFALNLTTMINDFGIGIIIIFFFILILGLIYEITRGVLDFNIKKIGFL